MDDFLHSLSRLFTDAPYIYLSWPAVAMVVGTALALISPPTATQLANTPRTIAGLVGLATAPFVHTNLAHLLANLPPFVVLGYLILRHGAGEFLQAAWMIALAQGALLWLCGRRAAHVGMSGVIFGFLGWLVGLAYFTQTTTEWLVACGVLLFYGGMLAGVAPARDGSSWEGHLFGLIAGVGVVWLTHGL
jgi:Uncharacterized membrane protein (homolog of Drosophila rhomboid)